MVNISSKDKFDLKKFVKELNQFSGRHTEFVSVYIPEGYDINKVINQLQQEQGTASNIKSASTRKNVTDALERMIQHLRLFKQTPPNGLAVFSGNVASAEGKSDLRIWSIEPPVPLRVKIYRCDKNFVTEHLEEMMEVKEVYGLVVLDMRDADIALLKGKTIIPLRKTHSEVPGKMRAGGQCLATDSVIQCSSGDLLQINEVHNHLSLKSARFDNFSIIDSRIVDKWIVKKKAMFKIVTKYPRLVVECSKDHVFFVSTSEGIMEKPASDLKKGDFLIMPEKLDFKGKSQKLKSSNKYSSINRKVSLPSVLSCELAQLIGYFLGDGSYEMDRLNFHESDKDVAIFYKKLSDDLFNLNTRLVFREKKNYFLSRVYSRGIVNLFKTEFPEIRSSLTSSVPEKVLLSDNKVVASFLRGLFDAECYVSSRLAIGMNNKFLIHQLQLLLLRFGILSSFLEYDNLRNPYSDNIRYILEVSEKKSLELFRDNIGLSCKRKMDKLISLINKKKDGISYVREILVSGKKIRELIEEAGYNVNMFPKVNSFFRNERMMSKQIFSSSVIQCIPNKSLRAKLVKIKNYLLLPVKINKIDFIKNPVNLVDISVSNQNFIANGVLVHNSAARFGRIREGAIKDHFKKIAEYMKEQFLSLENLKGIIIGGPGTTVNNFLNKEYLTGDVKKKIIATKDLSYTGSFGLQELVDRSQDVLANEEVTAEKEIVQKFIGLLATAPGKVAYGIKEVEAALNMGAVEILLLSESLDDKDVEKFEELAKKFSTDVRVISVETSEGVQLKEMGKVAAILRYEVSS